MNKETWVRFAQSGPLLEQRRQTLRLADHDYSQGGAYFVTLCAQDRECLFGEVRDGAMFLNDLGRIVQEEWLRSAAIRPDIQLGAFVVMPNHFHAILVSDAGSSPVPEKLPSPAATLSRASRSLGSLIGGFKGAVTRRFNVEQGTSGMTVWQRNYHERIIRNDDNMHKARLYIANNPTHWPEDVNNPVNLPPPGGGTASV